MCAGGARRKADDRVNAGWRDRTGDRHGRDVGRRAVADISSRGIEPDERITYSGKRTRRSIATPTPTATGSASEAACDSHLHSLSVRVYDAARRCATAPKSRCCMWKTASSKSDATCSSCRR
jgi:hypothetical protein